MPTSIVAEPIITPIAELTPISQQIIPGGMKINPWFDWSPFLGIPFWVLVCAFFILILISVNGYWLFRMKKLSAVRGYVEAMKKASQEDIQVWVLGKTRKLTIECLKYVDSVLSYYDKLKITRWHHNTPFSVVQIGGTPAMVVSDDFDQTRDIVSEIALCYMCEEFNDNQEQLKNEIETKYKERKDRGEELEKPTIVKPITNYSDYSKYGRKCLISINPNGLEIPPYNIFDPVKFRKYFPKGCSAGFFGGEFLRDARTLKPRVKQATFWDKVLPLGIVSGIAVAALLAGWMAPVGA